MTNFSVLIKRNVCYFKENSNVEKISEKAD
jgi:hypothetical protein